MNALLTPFIFNSYSSIAYEATSSNSGPYNVVFAAIRLFFTLVIEVDLFTSNKINLSGITPIFYRASAYTLVLGNPSTTQLCPSFSYFIISFLTKSMIILSSTIHNKLITTYHIYITSSCQLLLFHTQTFYLLPSSTYLLQIYIPIKNIQSMLMHSLFCHYLVGQQWIISWLYSNLDYDYMIFDYWYWY